MKMTVAATAMMTSILLTQACPQSVARRERSGAANLFRKSCRVRVSNMNLPMIRRPVRTAMVKCIA